MFRKLSLLGNHAGLTKEVFPSKSRFKKPYTQRKYFIVAGWMQKTRGDAEAARLVYGKTRNKVTAMMRKAKRKHEKEIALKSQTNPKAFWSHIRRKLKTKTGIAPLLENNKDKASTKFKDLEKANILQKQFSSVFTHEPEGEMPLLSNRSEASICHFNVTEEMVHDELLNLNINKSCGPDEIHPRLLKELAATISKPIAFLFNKSLQYGNMERYHWTGRKQMCHRSTKKVLGIEQKTIVQSA